MEPARPSRYCIASLPRQDAGQKSHPTPRERARARVKPLRREVLDHSSQTLGDGGRQASCNAAHSGARDARACGAIRAAPKQVLHAVGRPGTHPVDPVDLEHNRNPVKDIKDRDTENNMDEDARTRAGASAGAECRHRHSTHTHTHTAPQPQPQPQPRLQPQPCTQLEPETEPQATTTFTYTNTDTDTETETDTTQAQTQSLYLEGQTTTTSQTDKDKR